MATMVGTQRDLTALLEQMIQLEYDALEAYKVAVEHLQDDGLRWHLQSFMADHERHVEELTAALTEMGAEAPEGPDAKQLITTAKVFFGVLLGDRAILGAMRANEDDTNTACERAVARVDTPAHLRKLFVRHLADERRHRDWLEGRIGLQAPEVIATD